MVAGLGLQDAVDMTLAAIAVPGEHVDPGLFACHRLLLCPCCGIYSLCINMSWMHGHQLSGCNAIHLRPEQPPSYNCA